MLLPVHLSKNCLVNGKQCRPWFFVIHLVLPLVQRVVGCGKVSCILHHQGVQVNLAYSWQGLLSLWQVGVEGNVFIFFYFFPLIPVPLSSLSLSFISSTISSIFPFCMR